VQQLGSYQVSTDFKDEQPAPDEEATPRQLSYFSFIVAFVLLVCSMGLNFWFGYLLYFKKDSSYRWPPPPTTLEAATGGHPQLSRLRDLDGHPYTLNSSDGRILYLFSPTSGWCLMNRPPVSELFQRLESRYEVIGIVQSTDGMAEYLSKYRPPFKILLDDDPADLAAMDWQGWPQTIVLANGRVVHNWRGVYSGPVRDAIQNTFQVSIVSAPSQK
jgi:hypothetical protein